MSRNRKTITQQRKKLPHGICHVASCPVRSKPDDRAEMVTQILFGECLTIVKQYKNWIKVQLEYDEYIGWMDVKQIIRIDEEEFEELTNSDITSLDTVQSINNNNIAFPILLGSTLPNFDGLHLQMPDSKYIFNGMVMKPEQITNVYVILERVAKMYLHAPYLWGGRSIFGIDCSGFTQMVFKILGIKLPRDASQQVHVGETVDFIEQVQIGDLAYFHNEEDKITHVGIILQNRTIIHASGKVKIDLIDHHGIYSNEYKKYTHSVKIIKRILPNIPNDMEVEEALSKELE